MSYFNNLAWSFKINNNPFPRSNNCISQKEHEYVLLYKYSEIINKISEYENNRIDMFSLIFHLKKYNYLDSILKVMWNKLISQSYNDIKNIQKDIELLKVLSESYCIHNYLDYYPNVCSHFVEVINQYSSYGTKIKPIDYDWANEIKNSFDPNFQIFIPSLNPKSLFFCFFCFDEQLIIGTRKEAEKLGKKFDEVFSIIEGLQSNNECLDYISSLLGPEFRESKTMITRLIGKKNLKENQFQIDYEDISFITGRSLDLSFFQQYKSLFMYLAGNSKFYNEVKSLKCIKNNTSIPLWIIVLRMFSSFDQIQEFDQDEYNAILKNQMKNCQINSLLWYSFINQSGPIEFNSTLSQIMRDLFNNLNCDEVLATYHKPLHHYLEAILSFLMQNNHDEIMKSPESFQKNPLFNPKTWFFNFLDNQKQSLFVKWIISDKSRLEKKLEECHGFLDNINHMIEDLLRTNNTKENL